MIRSKLLTLMLVMLLGLSSTLSAAAPASLEQLETQIEQLGTDDAGQSPLRDLYQRTLAAIRDQQQYQQRAEALQQQLEAQPAALESLQRQLQQPPTSVDPESFDSAPDVYFRRFAESDLDIDLRIFVSSMSDRIPVTDELNKAIHRLFNEHGIEIAYPQLDVHLHRAKPAAGPTAT